VYGITARTFKLKTFAMSCGLCMCIAYREGVLGVFLRYAYILIKWVFNEINDLGDYLGCIGCEMYRVSVFWGSANPPRPLKTHVFECLKNHLWRSAKKRENRGHARPAL
jgi:hypothetical protein